MKNIPLILVVILALAWGYTSWYWYVCNIKGLCNSIENIQREEPREENNFFIEKSVNEENSQININIDQDAANILTSDDVLSTDFTKDEKPEEVGKIEESLINTGSLVEDKEITDESSSSGTVLEDTENNKDLEEITQLVGKDICKTPLVGPIGIGAQNNISEVELLEQFLIDRGEEISIDGVYGNDDFEAVKRFQLEYREKILDPWDIQNPTGYVFRTTVKTINEIACQ